MEAEVKSFDLRPRTIFEDVSSHSYGDLKFQSNFAAKTGRTEVLLISRFTEEIAFEFYIDHKYGWNRPHKRCRGAN